MTNYTDIYSKSKAEIFKLLNECEKALEIEQRYHAILDNMMEGFQIIGYDWTYLYMNTTAVKQSRHTEKELIGHTMMENYPGIEDTELFTYMRVCMNNRVPQHLENWFVHADGSVEWFELRMQPVEEGIFVLSMDITARKKAEEDLIRLNEVLEQKVMLRTAQLAAKNKELTDSIRYAKKIQKAFLPNRSDLQEIFPDSFMLLKPKDLVSGDFYWQKKINDKIIFAVADCTGHGVPGALISIIGAHVLNDIVLQNTDPSIILKELNKRIKIALRQSGSDASTRDGMDIALCCFDTVEHIMHYTGANRPFWLIRKDDEHVEEFGGTKASIGGLTDNEQQFELHKIALRKGDTFYIASDGYADQDGGEKGKKMMTKNFKQLLINVQSLPMDLQQNYLDAFIEDWRGNRIQMDDILVIGIRL